MHCPSTWSSPSSSFAPTSPLGECPLLSPLSLSLPSPSLPPLSLSPCSLECAMVVRTMERVDSEGQIATAFTFARLLSNIPLTQRGPVKIMIYDIHALQERLIALHPTTAFAAPALEWVIISLCGGDATQLDSTSAKRLCPCCCQPCRCSLTNLRPTTVMK